MIEAPSLTIDSAGHVHLAWASQTSETERSTFLASSSNAGRTFSKPALIRRTEIFVAVSESDGRPIRRALRMAPHVVAAGDALYLAATETTADGSTVQMRLAKSAAVYARNPPRTFLEPVAVHQSLKARPTFTGIARGPLTDGTLTDVPARGMLAASWLDNRSGMQQVYAAVRPAGSDTFDEELLVCQGSDGHGVCPCCPTSPALAADGTLYVAFRNHVDGYRDIWIARLPAGAKKFDPPLPVVAPTWQFDGCPHDGPSLVVVGDKLHIAWMDGRSGVPKVYFGVASRDDMKFVTRPLNAAAPGSQNNPRLCVDSHGDVHAAWEECLSAEAPIARGSSSGAGKKKGGSHAHNHALQGDGRAIMYARLDNAAAAHRAIALRRGVFQTRPAIACSAKGDVFVAFNELDTEGKRVVVTCLTDATSTYGESSGL